MVYAKQYAVQGSTLLDVMALLTIGNTDDIHGGSQIFG
jgi:hypothetical protein